MDTFQVWVFDSLGINQFTLAPESDFRNFDGWGVDPEIDFFAFRSRYEKYLEEGKKVRFKIYSTKGKVSYKLVIQTQ